MDRETLRGVEENTHTHTHKDAHTHTNRGRDTCTYTHRLRATHTQTYLKQTKIHILFKHTNKCTHIVCLMQTHHTNTWSIQENTYTHTQTHTHTNTHT